MRQVVKRVLLRLLISASAICLSPLIGSAQEYFGEDLNPGGTVPAESDAVMARQEFLNALTSGVKTENFESFGNGRLGPLPLAFTGSFGDINAVLSGDGEIRTESSFGRFPTSGNRFWENTGSFSIEFSAPVAAFGFYTTDVGDFNGNITLRTENGVEKNYVIPNTRNGPSGSLLFYGLIDRIDPFQSVHFGNTASGTDFFGFDDLTVGDIPQVVPAPGPTPTFSLPLRGGDVVFNTEPGGGNKDCCDYYNFNHSKGQAYYSIDFDSSQDVDVVAAANGRVVYSDVQIIGGEQLYVVRDIRTVVFSE